jgi:hypothetical protein
MTDQRIRTSPIPDWFLEAVRVMQDADHMLRNIETELRYAMGLKGLSPGLRADMQSMQDALGAAKVSLSVMDMTARRILTDFAKPDSPRRRLASAP